MSAFLQELERPSPALVLPFVASVVSQRLVPGRAREEIVYVLVFWFVFYAVLPKLNFGKKGNGKDSAAAKKPSSAAAAGGGASSSAADDGDSEIGRLKASIQAIKECHNAEVRRLTAALEAKEAELRAKQAELEQMRARGAEPVSFITRLVSNFDAPQFDQLGADGDSCRKLLSSAAVLGSPRRPLMSPAAASTVTGPVIHCMGEAPSIASPMRKYLHTALSSLPEQPTDTDGSSHSHSHSRSRSRPRSRLAELFAFCDAMETERPGKRVPLEALSRLEREDGLRPGQVEVHWRMARACRYAGEDPSEPTCESISHERKKELLTQGLQYALRAVELDSSCALAHKWAGIMYGVCMDYFGFKDKILNSYKIREHMGRTIALRPHDSICHYILGRWHAGIADLSWAERAAASTFIATPPESTHENALRCFLKAEEAYIEVNGAGLGYWIDNTYWAAQMYGKLGDKAQQKEWLLKAEAFAPAVVSNEDVDTLAAVRQALARL